MKSAIEMAKSVLPKGGYKREYLKMMKESIYGDIVSEHGTKRTSTKFSIESRL